MKIHIHFPYRPLAALLIAACWLLAGACSDEALDYNNPNVDIFVKQLKAGKYVVQQIDSTGVAGTLPNFTFEDIETLLKYAEDLTEIPDFPLAPISYLAGGKLRLGECILWTVETIRLGHNASLGCKMVHVDAMDYEGIYFLTDEEVQDAAARYRRWWEERKYPPDGWAVDPCYDDPLCASGYMWW